MKQAAISSLFIGFAMSSAAAWADLGVPEVGDTLYQGSAVVSYGSALAGSELAIQTTGNEFLGSTTVPPWGWGRVNLSRQLTISDGILAIQKRDGVESDRSATVSVKLVPAEFLQHREILFPPVVVGPLVECQRGALISRVIQGARLPWEVRNGSVSTGESQTPYVSEFVALPELVENEIVRARQTLEDLGPSRSELSEPETVGPRPTELSKPVFEIDIGEDGVSDLLAGATAIVLVDLFPGATIKVLKVMPDGELIAVGGGIATGERNLVSVEPLESGLQYIALQSMCDLDATSDPVDVGDQIAIPVVQAPICPGTREVRVEHTQFTNDVEVFINGISRGLATSPGGTTVVLLSEDASLEKGDVVTAQQSNVALQSDLDQVVPVIVSSTDGVSPCTDQWPTFQHDNLRTANQMDHGERVTDVGLLTELGFSGPSFQFPASDAQRAELELVDDADSRDYHGFSASPIVYRGFVYVGSHNGRMYALDATNLSFKWEFPERPQAPLQSSYGRNTSSRGIASTAAMATISGKDVVLFAAPDQSVQPGEVGLPGSNRIFALDAQTGELVKKSPQIALLTGTTTGDLVELHQQIGYSSLVVRGDVLYVGIGDHGDDPIQNGRVIALNVEDLSIITDFTFFATADAMGNSDSTRGGGVWTHIAAGLGIAEGVFFTTGNTKSAHVGLTTEPAVNHGLSMLRIDQDSGDISWKLQPVPFELDEDPDWAGGVTLVTSRCGTLSQSTMKDGFTYSVYAGARPDDLPGIRWQFPSRGTQRVEGDTVHFFEEDDHSIHGDSRFFKSGATWNDVFFTAAGGLDLDLGAQYSVYNRLYALESCGSGNSRIRWYKDIPGVRGSYALGHPTVTDGIVFVGTRDGRILAIADPSKAPHEGYQCSYPHAAFADLENCILSNFELVSDPAVLFDIALPGCAHPDRSIYGIWAAPAIVNDRIYVASRSGNIYLLEP